MFFVVNPIVLDFILMYEKTRYECVYRFFKRENFEYVETDTDSAYIALSGRLEDLVIPAKRVTYFEEMQQWFPRPFCSLHCTAYILTQ